MSHPIRDDWSKRRCLVTGGMGFGGGHLCEQLIERGATVYVLDRFRPENSYLVLQGLGRRVEYVCGDIRDLELLNLLLHRYDIDTVFHLAAQPSVPMSKDHPLETLSINAMGTYCVLEAVRNCPWQPTLVFASSGAVYGTTHQQELIDEDYPASPAANTYGPSKIAGDFAVRSYVRAFGIKAAVCRFINTYGPGSTNFSTIVPRTIYNLIEDLPYDFGDRDDGSTRFDYLHVRDMARGYIAVAEHIDEVQGEAFNFSGGRMISVRDLVTLISRLYDGGEREPLFRGAPREVTICKRLSCGKAQTQLGWSSSIDLEDGLAETVAWYRDNWPRITKRVNDPVSYGESPQ